MLVIRKAQIDAMLKGDEDEFLNTLVARVTAEDPGLKNRFDPQQLRNMARLALDRAESYGFEHARDQIAFVALMFRKGPRFDAESDVRSILEDSSLPAAQKLQRLDPPLVPDAVWEKIAAERDDSKWFES